MFYVVVCVCRYDICPRTAYVQYAQDRLGRLKIFIRFYLSAESDVQDSERYIIVVSTTNRRNLSTNGIHTRIYVYIYRNTGTYVGIYFLISAGSQQRPSTMATDGRFMARIIEEPEKQ